MAATVAAILVLWSPFISQVRAWVRAAFPGRFTAIVAVCIGAAVAAAIGLALRRIRDRRAIRYALIAAAIVFGVGYAIAVATGNPEVDAVERFHFVEYGLVTWLFYRAWRPIDDVSVLVLPALAGLIVGAIDEWFQWFIPVRIGELHDVLLNGAAIGSGLLFSAGLDPPHLAEKFRPGSLRRLGRFAAASMIAVAAFIHVVHLGHEIRDAEIGVFRSRYSAEDLASLSRARADAWRERPPAVLRRLSAEDQYMSEGVWHAQRRNEKWAAGDIVAAWRENRILEKFYAPVLDTPSYVSAAGFRWPPEQRADAAARAGGDRRPFVSDAHPFPIYVWPKAILWLLVGAVACAVVFASAARDRRAA